MFLYYVNKDGPNHGPVLFRSFYNSVLLPDKLLAAYLDTLGFCDFTLDNNVITQIIKNNNLCEEYKNAMDNIVKPTEITFESIQQENKLLKAQLQAQTDRSDFIEECIAEMAGVVYNTEEITM